MLSHYKNHRFYLILHFLFLQTTNNSLSTQPNPTQQLYQPWTPAETTFAPAEPPAVSLIPFAPLISKNAQCSFSLIPTQRKRKSDWINFFCRALIAKHPLLFSLIGMIGCGSGCQCGKKAAEAQSTAACNCKSGSGDKCTCAGSCGCAAKPGCGCNSG